ncbi:DUF1361 domain-containing protein [Croceitalea vernalis]|uniref:DUF1361 domain-containing protein n=1 Tax=Croceitalea vernalis TaxID=3075599 RepID=A0ABU3BJG2_9FLAO|nr:DUF1361 domain-containing protein [Croceitalea sp. P007]MDT0622306.1 DUF1361 domain-containing protein [Croceitalea sp. P007]
MKIKELVNQKFKEIGQLIFGLILFIVLLAFRIKVTKEVFLLFLSWNLILALIPLVITLILYKNPSLMAKRWTKAVFTFLWLLFLPNAPYIITDFIHLKFSTSTYLLLDTLIISIAALTGFLSGVYSFRIMKEFYSLNYPKKIIGVFTVFISFLCGFGVYLGRVIRLNSWDFFFNPMNTILMMLESITQPLAWITTIIFGLLMLIALFKLDSNKVDKN